MSAWSLFCEIITILVIGTIMALTIGWMCWITDRVKELDKHISTLYKNDDILQKQIRKKGKKNG